MTYQQKLEVADPKLKELREKATQKTLNDGEEFNYFWRLQQARKLVRPAFQSCDEWYNPVD
jgi:hypothetical protein